MRVLISVGYAPQMGVAGSWDGRVSNLRKTVSIPKLYQFAFPSAMYKRSSHSIFFHIIHSDGLWWNLVAALICTPLMTNDTELPRIPGLRDLWSLPRVSDFV